MGKKEGPSPLSSKSRCSESSEERGGYETLGCGGGGGVGGGGGGGGGGVGGCVGWGGVLGVGAKEGGTPWSSSVFIQKYGT